MKTIEQQTYDYWAKLTDAEILSHWTGGAIDPALIPVLRDYGKAIEAAVREKCAKVCEAQLDLVEQEQAEKRARDARGEDNELIRLRHATNVALYNVGLRRCAAAIRGTK